MTRYRVSAQRSTVDADLEVNVHPSHLNARGVSGLLEVDLDANGDPRLDRPYSAELSLPVRRLTSGNALQDAEMRRRFDAVRHPLIGVTLQTARPLGAGRYRATLRLSMHGVTRVLRSDVAFAARDSVLEIDGALLVDMRRFRIDPPRLAFMRVEPEVQVRVHLVARAVSGPPRRGTARRAPPPGR
jgi:polyisoprenoid-binding protein YceI